MVHLKLLSGIKTAALDPDSSTRCRHQPQAQSRVGRMNPSPEEPLFSQIQDTIQGFEDELNPANRPRLGASFGMKSFLITSRMFEQAAFSNCCPTTGIGSNILVRLKQSKVLVAVVGLKSAAISVFTAREVWL